MITTLMKQVDLVPLWKALADSKRRRIIRLLAEKTRTTSEISAYFDVSRFAVMRHLKVLEQAELIKTRREGRQRWNFLNEDLFQQIQQAYLENGAGGEYQLNDILTLLFRQDETGAKETAGLEQPPIELDVPLQAPPDRVFQALTDEIDAWWSYRVTIDSHVHLESHVGGHFYEAFNAGGGALYALVTFVKPGEEIRLNGSMGLADQAISNLVHFTVQLQQPNSTRLQLTHRFLGRVNAVTVDTFRHSWEELLTQHLKSFVEQGTRYRAPL
jgi:DNA-binding transcriptional ArsR family regulator/uncharacterized protein YndB with AHSA1/START domain